MTRRGKVIQFPKRPPAPGPAPALVEVRRCRDQSEALVVRALLDGHGIPAVMRGQNASGTAKGHIHRLKLVKRQGYGRAGFALIRQRVLQAA